MFQFYYFYHFVLVILCFSEDAHLCEIRALLPVILLSDQYATSTVPVGLAAIGCRCARKVSTGRFWSDRTPTQSEVSDSLVNTWEIQCMEEGERRGEPGRLIGRGEVFWRGSWTWRKSAEISMRECREGAQTDAQSTRNESEVRLWYSREAGMPSTQACDRTVSEWAAFSGRDWGVYQTFNMISGLIQLWSDAPDTNRASESYGRVWPEVLSDTQTPRLHQTFIFMLFAYLNNHRHCFLCLVSEISTIRCLALRKK